MEFCKIFGNLIRFLCISMTIIYVLGFTQDFLIKVFATHKYFFFKPCKKKHPQFFSCHDTKQKSISLSKVVVCFIDFELQYKVDI